MDSQLSACVLLASRQVLQLVLHSLRTGNLPGVQYLEHADYTAFLVLQLGDIDSVCYGRTSHVAFALDASDCNGLLCIELP